MSDENEETNDDKNDEITGIELAEKIEELAKACADEHDQREEIRKGKKYMEKQAAIVKLSGELDAMLEDVPDSVPDFEKAKKDMIAEMQQSGRAKIGKVSARYTKSNRVNGAGVFRTLGEDIGLFMEIATISQKSLKEWAKGNPDLKDELIDCIEEAGQTVTDISIETE